MGWGGTIKVGTSGYYCWVCGLVFTTLPSADGDIHCPNCQECICPGKDPLWDRNTAWCGSCRMQYGYIWNTAVPPQCPICKHGPNDVLDVEKHKKGEKHEGKSTP